jgi:tripartite ATP-independent transporter DctM subunit
MLVVIYAIFTLTFLIGVPIAFALGLAGALYIVFQEGLPTALLVRRIYFALDSFPLVAIPLFIMIGHLSDRSGLIPRLMSWLQVCVGWMKGGLAYINVLDSMIFAGVSGTAVSDVASLGPIAIGMMNKAGYEREFSCALTAATAIMGPIIPPSVAMIIYALAAGNVSIAGLFLAGAIPGVFMGVCLLVYCYFKTRKGTYAWTRQLPSLREVLLETLKVVPLLLLPLIILGGVLGGVVTVTETAAIGVIYVMLVGFCVTRELHWRDVRDAIVYAAKTSSVLAMLMGAGAITSWIMTRNQVPAQLTKLMISVSDDPTVFMLVVFGALTIIGCLMDATAVIIALTPLLAPVALQYGIPDLQFGLVFLMTVLVGMITPPVGIVLFLTASVGRVSLEKLSIAILPFVVVESVVIIVAIFFPPLTLWLPRILGFY